MLLVMWEQYSDLKLVKVNCQKTGLFDTYAVDEDLEEDFAELLLLAFGEETGRGF